MATFTLVWDSIPLNTKMKVSDGLPPPSTNTEGAPYNAWRSHNFIGTLEEKIQRNSWRYLKFEVDPTTTGDQMLYLAYDIAEGQGHNFELVA